MDYNNNGKVDHDDFVKFLKKNTDMMCNPYKRKIEEVIEQRVEVEKEIKKLVRKHAGEHIEEGYCLDMME